jgi:hypothetical protein
MYKWPSAATNQASFTAPLAGRSPTVAFVPLRVIDVPFIP